MLFRYFATATLIAWAGSSYADDDVKFTIKNPTEQKVTLFVKRSDDPNRWSDIKLEPGASTQAIVPGGGNIDIVIRWFESETHARDYGVKNLQIEERPKIPNRVKYLVLGQEFTLWRTWSRKNKGDEWVETPAAKDTSCPYDIVHSRTDTRLDILPPCDHEPPWPPVKKEQTNATRTPRR
jgi:hypothetical protein